VRDSNFGALWDVVADISLAGDAKTNTTANTGLRLGPHTDLPTREIPLDTSFFIALSMRPMVENLRSPMVLL
jgi:gamma-butyrobetaine dioxygenase